MRVCPGHSSRGHPKHARPHAAISVAQTRRGDPGSATIVGGERIGRARASPISGITRSLAADFYLLAAIFVYPIYYSTRRARARVDVARVFVCHAQGMRDSNDSRAFGKFEEQSERSRNGGGAGGGAESVGQTRLAAAAACNCKQ